MLRRDNLLEAIPILIHSFRGELSAMRTGPMDPCRESEPHQCPPVAQGTNTIWRDGSFALTGPLAKPHDDSCRSRPEGAVRARLPERIFQPGGIIQRRRNAAKTKRWSWMPDSIERVPSSQRPRSRHGRHRRTARGDVRSLRQAFSDDSFAGRRALRCVVLPMLRGALLQRLG
jgi:hypothetical protein